jgi:lipoate-protein ligase A|tara:strand:- start:3827 stop:4141 length:315 start_codon:yes stop_codon:yes gene_type:complete
MAEELNPMEENIKRSCIKSVEQQINNFIQLQEGRDALMNQKLESMREALENDMQEHHHSLYGNGKDGLTERVTRIEEDKKASYRIYSMVASGLSMAIAWLALRG